MKTNVGTIDRVARILIAVIIAGLYYFNQISGTTAIILLVLAGIFILTGLVSFCPIYMALGISTNKKQK